MMTDRVSVRFSRKLAELLQCNRGNVAMMFGLAIIPLVGLVGAAIDYSRANDARTGLQVALDAAALSLSKDAQKLTTEQLQTKARSVFDANFHNSNVKNIKVTPIFTTIADGSYSLKLSATGTVDTTVAGIWQPTIDIGTSTEVVWGMKRLELILALDNTGSMASSGKMTQLKVAAKDLLKTLQNAAKKPEDVKVGIVPFTTDVNVGTGNVKANWIRWDEWEAHADNFTCMKNGKEVKDGKKRITSASDCKKEDNNATWTLNAKSTWGGCVWDRDQPNDTNNVATGGGKTTLYSAHTADDCPVAMMPLTNSWTALNSKVDSMQPAGNTNVTI